MSTTTDLSAAASGPEKDPPPDPEPAARSGAIGDIRKFLDDAEEDLPGPDSPLGEIALSRGYLTEEQLEECLAEQKVTTPHVLIGELLQRKKYITGEQLLRALTVQKKPEPAPQLPEGAKIGKYSLIRELGRGGMGIVFEAQDPDLKRRVAIKVLKDEVSDPTAAERMRREAAIAAQLRHPGIVSIHEVGTTKPRKGPPLPFFAMDYVEGKTLADLIEEKKTPRKELLRILEDVARAVAHAHGAGVVHRDLKPANVIVEKSGRAVLSDFGIARATTFQTRITETSFVVGTPEYMAPEQIQDHADHVGPATDIHALGVILYEILTGMLPYRAETPVGLMRKIIAEEPVPPRKITSTVEADLQVICLKALEKEVTRRYATADAFADDLLRFRTGKPIAARAAGPLSRLWTKILRRKKTAAVVAASLTVALLAVVLFGAWARGERREALRQLNERMDTALRAALELRRAGDTARMKTFAREAVDACEAAAARYPDLAEPHALQGRLQRALLEYDRALEEQELALARDPLSGLARYERLVLTSRLLRRREDELVERAWRGLGQMLIQEGTTKVRSQDAAIPPREKLTKDDAAARELRARMDEDLRLLETAEIGEAERSCARGLVRRSRAPLQAALAKSPALEEAVEALARLEEDDGKFEKAVAVWTEGLEHDKGCLPHLEGLGGTRLHWGHQKYLKGEDPSAPLIAAVGDFTHALEKDPKRDGAMRERGLAHFLLGYSIGWSRPDDATRQFLAAEDDLGRAIALNPKAAATWMWRGVVRAALAVGKLLQLKDPVALCEQAMADLSKAVECNPKGDEPYFWRAYVRVPWSFWLALQRQDIEPLYKASLADLEQALGLNPNRGDTWLGRANIHMAWAGYQKTRGKDPTEILRKAASDLEIAIQKLPDGIQAPERRGQLELQFASAPGEDPAKRYRAAIGYFDTLLARSPKSIGGLSGRGEAQMRLAAELLKRGGSPSAAYDAAFRDLDEAAASDAGAKILRAEAFVRRGEWKAAAGRDADADFQAAIADAKAALALNPFATDAWIWQGRARTLGAAYRPAPMLHYPEAISDFGRVITVNPDHLLALRFRADALQRRATLKATRRLDAGADFQSALVDYEHLVRLQPAMEPELREAITACKAGIDASKR